MIANTISLKENLEEIVPHVDETFPYLVYYEDLRQYRGGYVPWHWHEEVELFTVLQGKMKLSTNRGEYIVSAGEGVFLNSNTMHMYEPVPGYEAIITGEVFLADILSGGVHSVFHQKYIAPVLENEALDTLILHPSSPLHRQMIAHLRASQDAADLGDYGYELTVRNHLSEVWLQIAKNAPEPTAEQKRRGDAGSERIKKMMLYIREHYGDKISLSDIASSAGISDRECLRCFQNNLSTTPFTYLLRYRCRIAADRLKHSADPVTEIAYSCGFSGPSYFGKIFRQEMGCSPSEYRKQ